MYRGLRSAFLAVFVGLLVTIGGATGTTLTYTSFSTWKSGVTGTPVEANFNTIGSGSYSTAAGISLVPLTGDPANAFVFTGPDNGAFSLSGTSSYDGFTGLEGAAESGAGIHIAAPAAGENAILLAAYSTSSTPLTLTLSDGENFTLSNGVYGFSASHPITWLTLSTTTGSQVFVDDLYFGASSSPQDAADIPEGAPLTMLAGGLLILIGVKRRIGVAPPTSL